MAPSQTTRSPRRLRKEAERMASRDKSYTAEYHAEIARGERCEAVLTDLKTILPDASDEVLQSTAMELANMNRSQRRASKKNMRG